jgi:hypothetical protein
MAVLSREKIGIHRLPTIQSLQKVTYVMKNGVPQSHMLWKIIIVMWVM